MQETQSRRPNPRELNPKDPNPRDPNPRDPNPTLPKSRYNRAFLPCLFAEPSCRADPLSTVSYYMKITLRVV